MRLGEWRAAAPARDALGTKVLAVVTPVLTALGADADPHAWVTWGDDPSSRYTVLVPTPPGLIVAHVRVNVAGEGPRASAKLVRWSRVQVGELAVETQGGHRMISFQVESILLRGADDLADRIGSFALALLGAIDGRPLPDLDGVRPRRGRPAASRPAAKGSSARAAPTSARAASNRTKPPSGSANG